MIDAHSHILPNIDDGSTDIEMTHKLLQLMQKQGIKTVVATSHFYPQTMDKEDFIKKREEAFRLIKNPAIPILKGCELLFHPCVMGYDNVDELCIEGSKYILIELNYTRLWDIEMVTAIESFSNKFQVKPIIAHVERYAAIRKKASLLDNLIEIGALIQINGEGFQNFWERRYLLKLIKSGKVDIIASDAHNLTSRKPNLPKAYEYVKKSCGEKVLNQLQNNAKMVIEHNYI